MGQVVSHFQKQMENTLQQILSFPSQTSAAQHWTTAGLPQSGGQTNQWTLDLGSLQVEGKGAGSDEDPFSGEGGCVVEEERVQVDSGWLPSSLWEGDNGDEVVMK